MGKRYYPLIVYFRLLFFQSYSPKKTYTMVLIFITPKYLTVSCIPATIVSDICRIRFRYLSYSFQISVVFVLDICRVCFRYLSYLFQISVVFVSDICKLPVIYPYKYLHSQCCNFVVVQRFIIGFIKFIRIFLVNKL